MRLLAKYPHYTHPYFWRTICTSLCRFAVAHGLRSLTRSYGEGRR